MSRSLITVIICAFVLCILVMPVSAVLQEVTVKSTVSTVNPAKNALTIGFPLQYGCSYPSSGAPVCTWTPMQEQSLTGTVPDASALALFKAGDPIVATSIGGPGGSWIALAKLYGSRPNEEFVTDIVGDPSAIPTPFIGDYTLSLTPTPDCTRCSGATCTAVSANVTVSSAGRSVFSKTLTPNQNLFFNGRNDGSSVSVTFIRGEAMPGPCLQNGITGMQPVSVYLVTIVPPVGYGQVNIRTATTTQPGEAAVTPAGVVSSPTPMTTSSNPAATTTPKAGSLPFVAVSAIGIAGVLMAIKKH